MATSPATRFHNLGSYRFAVLAAGVLLLSSAGNSTAAVFTVGAGGAAGGCTTDLVSLAVLTAQLTPNGPHTIRIARDQTYDGQWITISKSMRLEGGYTNCAETTAGTARTILDGEGGGSHPVIDVISGTVELVGLRLTGGEESGLRVSGGAIVELHNTWVQGNSSPAGGGVVVDGATLRLEEDSKVEFNDSLGDGGGIWCRNGILRLRGAVEDNYAASNGGGLYLEGCFVNGQGRSNSVICDNTAWSGNGGGLYAGDGSAVTLLAGDQHPFVVTDNQAQDGGGLYVTGAATRVEIGSSEVTSNRGYGLGAGIAVAANAELTMHRLDGPCDRGLRCSLLAGNTTISHATPSSGGGISVSGGAEADIRQTWVSRNGGHEQGGLGSVVGSGSRLIFESSVLVDNGLALDLALFRAEDGGLLRLAYVTLAGHFSVPDQYVVRDESVGHVELYSSIIAETWGTVFHPTLSSTVDARCVISPEFASFPGGAAIALQLVDPSPLFVDLRGRDLRLSADSAAIDFCDDASFVASDGDIHDEARGHDAPPANQAGRIFDVGADEWYLATSAGKIFADGFERGDVTSWSEVHP